MTDIDSHAFNGCTGLASVRLGEGIKRIGFCAFCGCTSLANVNIPGSATIEGGAFAGCISLAQERFIIRNGTLLAYIGKGGNVTIPSSVTTIGEEAFYGMDNLTGVTIPSSVKTIGEEAFYDSGLVRVTIPYGVTAIKCHAFAWSESLQNVSMPNSVVSIGEGAFEGCESLTQVAIPDSVVSLGGDSSEECGVFEECTNLRSVTIGKNVTCLGDCTFYRCSALTQVTIPARVNNIGCKAFARCTLLSSVVFKGNAPSVRTSEDDDEEDDLFYNSSTSLTVYVPKGSRGWGVAISGVWHGRRIEYGSGGNASGGDGSGTVDATFAKVQTVQGALYGADGKLAGAVTLKIGKKSKKGTVKISGSALLLNGKKAAAKAAQLTPGADGSGEVTLTFKAPVGAMTLKLASDGTFTCDGSGYTMVKAEVGGAWTTSDARVYLDVTSASLPAGARDELLPTEANGGEPVVPRGGKWGFAKAAQVKWAKDRATGAFGLTVNTAGGKTNKSGLKLTYAPKTGLFKGSFKVYAVVDNRLKKYTVKVTGLVVDGTGQGTATMTKPVAVTWTVTVE